MAQGYLGKARRSAISRGGDRKRNQGNPEEQSPSGQWDQVRGEGNYRAAREFDEAERTFVASGKLDEAVRKVPPTSEAEKRDMEGAEERARKRARGEDPALFKRPQGKPQGKR